MTIVLTTKSTIEEVLCVLENLIKDLDCEASIHALLYAKGKNENSRAEAMYYIGKRDLARQIIFNLGGESEAEGFKSIVDIHA